jgi:cytochrome c oxidase subunit 2
VNNVAYTTAEQTGKVTVRCDELCGLWHGAMFDYGKVMAASAFESWAQHTETQLAAVTKMLPAYATTYDPTVVPQINKVMAKQGIGGGNGYYYPPNDPVQP